MKKSLFIISIVLFVGCNKARVEKINSESSLYAELHSKERLQSFNRKDSTCNISIGVTSSSGLTFRIEQIDKMEYESNKKKHNDAFFHFSNSDSTEVILQKNYPKLFNKIDGKYVFKPENSKRDVVIWNNLVQDKTYSKYQFKASHNNFVIITQLGYESWLGLVVDLNTGKSYTFVGKPIFIDDYRIFSYSNYYGEIDLNIVNILNEKYGSATLSVDGGEIIVTDYYLLGQRLYLEFDCVDSGSKNYIRIADY